MPTLKEKICVHVEKSLRNSQYSEELSFSVSAETLRRVKAILHFDMIGYECIIQSHAIRHVKRGHPHEVKYICEIPEIMSSFYKVKKSITKDFKTGASLISLEFYKKYNNNIVKLVKLKIHTKKRLELKTLFIKEEQ